MIEAAAVGQRGAQRILAGMAERRMAEVVREAQGLGQILVEAERARDGAADLRDFEAVGQPDAEMIAVGRDEHLRLVAQAAERDRVDDPVAVALEDVARPARAGIRLGMKAAAGCRGIGGDRWRKTHSAASGTILSDCELVHLNASDADGLQVLGEDLARRTSRGTDRSAAAPGRDCARHSGLMPSNMSWLLRLRRR